MDAPIRVAVVRSDDRRTAVSRALELISDDIRRAITPEVLVKPNLVSHKSQLAATHPDTFSAVLDALFAMGVTQATVAEGATDASAGFERFGYLKRAAGRAVPFFDINREETRWAPLSLSAVDGAPLLARVSRTIADASCRVSLSVAKTHVTAMVTLGLKNMLSSIHPADRVMMHGAVGGNGYHGWKRLVVELLKQDNGPIRLLTRTAGRLRNARNAWRESRQTGDPFLALSASEVGYLRTVEAMNHNVVSLARKTKPHLSVVDGFVGMHREGPRHGTPIKLRTVIAGTDAVAVDAVAAAVMGFDPRAIGYLHYAQEAGLGVIDLGAITVLGDPIEDVRQPFVPHSNHTVQRHWSRLSESLLRGPHFAVAAPDRVSHR